jgi:hypothetical protein
MASSGTGRANGYRCAMARMRQSRSGAKTGYRRWMEAVGEATAVKDIADVANVMELADSMELAAGAGAASGPGAVTKAGA